jgi:hypothetical protein
VLDSVSVTSGGRSEVAPSLSAALEKLFAVDVDLGDRPAAGSSAASSAEAQRQELPDAQAEEPATPTDQPTVESLLAEADRLFDEAQVARQAFDSRGYEEKMEQAYAALREATELATGREVQVVDT